VNLVALDQGIRQQALAHLLDARGNRALVAADVELDQAADVDVLDAFVTQRRKGALDRLPLRVEDPLLGANQNSNSQRVNQF
jgi:hypothetical protein